MSGWTRQIEQVDDVFPFWSRRRLLLIWLRRMSVDPRRPDSYPWWPRSVGQSRPKPAPIVCSPAADVKVGAIDDVVPSTAAE